MFVAFDFGEFWKNICDLGNIEYVFGMYWACNIFEIVENLESKLCLLKKGLNEIVLLFGIY